MSMKRLELYVHIPFCERKCEYCDFLSFSADDGEKRAYVAQLADEIRAQGENYRDYLVSSIFIGGGTPTTLSGIWILEIMNTVRESFIVATDAEITIECNPGTLSKSKIMHIKKAGINRISFGLQSSIEEELKALGRIHTYKGFLQSYQLAREFGFTNINVDLMSGLPYQTIDSYKTTLKRVCELKPEHISAYSLIIEPGTPFFDKYGSGEETALLPDENEDRSMYAITKAVLKEHGYERYEISNYAKPGRECRHNIGYWTGVSYLGLGVGASGYVTKSTAHEEILKAIDKVIFKNDIYLNEKYATIFYELFKEDKEIELSEREKEVGRYIVEGYTLTDIGEKLFLSVKTVDTYKKRLMEKTNTKKRSELVEYLKSNLIL